MRAVIQIASAIAIAGVIVVLGAQVKASRDPAEPSSPPKIVEGSRIVDPNIRAIATRFILTAVARKNIAASWELLDPAFPRRSDFTKKTWSRGAIPVIPFPARSAGIHLAVSHARPRLVRLNVVLTAKKQTPQLFELGLRRHDSVKRRWLVSYWTPQLSHSGVPQ
jgi:hypothetical protein